MIKPPIVILGFGGGVPHAGTDGLHLGGLVVLFQILGAHFGFPLPRTMPSLNPYKLSHKLRGCRSLPFAMPALSLGGLLR